MGKEEPTITIQDITGALSFLNLRGINQITFRKEANGRVVGEAPATPEVYQLLAEFQGNPLIPLNEFLTCQRRLRGQMLDLRDAKDNGERKRETRHDQSK